MISVTEIFGPTIQGEGPLAGRQVLFIRTGGCDYRCGQNQETGEWTMPWRCDTLYSVLPEHASTWKKMSAQEVVDALLALHPGPDIPVILSGGNPALQRDIDALLDIWPYDSRPWIETQGSILPAWANRLGGIVLSPKPPSSGQPFRVEHEGALAAWIGAGVGAGIPVALKIAVLDRADLEWACAAADWAPELPFYLVPCNDEIAIGGGASPVTVGRGYKRLTDACLAPDAPPAARRATLIPQLHTLAWGNERGK